MPKVAPNDPYAGNILIAPLGPILSSEQVLSRLTMLPDLPPPAESVPKHLRLHHLMSVRDFHLPSREELRTQQTIDLMIRQGLRYRDPSMPQTWASVAGEDDPVATSNPNRKSRMPAMAGTAAGPSGVGKTEAVLQSLDRCYPSQVILHPSFPRMAGPFTQVVWLSIDIPASGRSADLAETLMREWDDLLLRAVPGYVPRFHHNLSMRRAQGSRMLSEWRQVASSHFLALLHLDEIQNLFKLSALKKRRTAKKLGSERLELSLVEDESLKWILTLTNTWQMPVLLTGTTDGVAAMSKRLATLQRMVSGGYHRFDPFQSAGDPIFVTFMSALGRYQYTRKRLNVDEVLTTVFELTAGIRRLIIALWIGAHRVALERSDDELRVADFVKASQTLLAPVAPAVKAMLSGSPDALRRYEDLCPDDDFWQDFWSQIQADLPGTTYA